MKLGLLADIHANYSALVAVTHALRARGCLRLLCAGDLVGGGPRPAECLELVRREQMLVVQGNHDAWVVRPQVVPGMGLDGRADMIWTSQALAPADQQYLAQLPMSLEYATVHCTHASAVPGRYWPYVRDEKMLRLHLQHQKRPLSLVGHTHVPALGVLRPDESVGFGVATGIVALAGRTMINPGSVGQPRDGDWRAACAILDTARREVEFLRLEYDLAEELHCLRAAALPPVYAARLQDGR